MTWKKHQLHSNLKNQGIKESAKSIQLIFTKIEDWCYIRKYCYFHNFVLIFELFLEIYSSLSTLRKAAPILDIPERSKRSDLLLRVWFWHRQYLTVVRYFLGLYSTSKKVSDRQSLKWDRQKQDKDR